MFLISFDRERGGLFLRAMLRRFRITLLNFESVRRARNLYSLIRRRTYGLFVYATRSCFLTR